MVVASTGGASSPFTGGGHYLTLASVYEGKVYILDPYLKTDYSKTDKRHLLTQIEPGLLEQAHGGSIYFDEVSDMPLGTQPKILRVLTEQQFARAGGSDKVRVDLRVI